MPDLDPEPNEKTGEELLAEFNIDAHGEMVRDDKDNEHNSLNCVLPSINSDPNDDVTMTEVNLLFSIYLSESNRMTTHISLIHFFRRKMKIWTNTMVNGTKCLVI